MLLVTGAAGFIGSNVVAGLNEAGRTDIAVNDIVGSEGKWRNLAKRQIADVVPPNELLRWLEGLREQRPPVAQAARLVHRDPHPLHLCFVGRDLRRRLGRLLR